jgi:hypothetical protein
MAENVIRIAPVSRRALQRSDPDRETSGPGINVEASRRGIKRGARCCRPVVPEWPLMPRALASSQVDALDAVVRCSHNPSVAGSNPARPTEKRAGQRHG